MRRDYIVALLVCLNLVLLTGLCLASYSLPTAAAQGTGLAGNYIMVAGEIQDEHDALYVFDLRARTLHVFYWDRGRQELTYSDWRDLERDFRNNRD
ncbi:MAG: hypothetical protein PVJ57_02695 [Phycisphaerae bacterium]|jgi:hypothetical protein